MATGANDRGESTAEALLPKQNTKSRFAMFVDSGDTEDTGGGVLLRDFEDNSNAISTPTAGCAPSRHVGAHSLKDMSSADANLANVSSSAPRNPIAPIGTGRYSETTPKSNAGGRLNARANTFTSTMSTVNKTREQDSTASNAKVIAANSLQNRAGATLGARSQTNAPQGMQPGFSQGLNTHFDKTPSINRTSVQYPHMANTSSNPWGTTPVTYNPASVAYNTPQPSGYGVKHGTALGSNFPYMSPVATPSHAPKKVGENQMFTPASVFPPNQYNQTEPRNFAPRAAGTPLYLPPPPAFSLLPDARWKKNPGPNPMEPDADPFVSPTASRATAFPSFSQALVLPQLPGDNMPTLMPRQMFYVPASAEIRALRSAQLNKLTEGPAGVPNQDVGLSEQNFPFIDATTQGGPVSHGVIKIKNIPFATKRAEIIAFLGRNSRILNDNQEPVHIIMERVSSKTQDCYVEFITPQDAIRAVERHKDNIQKGRPARLGDRPVDIQLSSQAALMQDLFPLASGVYWDNAKPVIQAPVEGQPWKTFKGFVTEEELTMLVKHVEMPQRSPYSKECPQRPYECMISTIKKFPWYMSDYITVAQRHSIVEGTMKMIVLLQQALQRGNRMQETMINEQLLKRLVTAAMLCPGFSVVQKDNIAVLAGMEPERARMFNQPRFAEEWVHLHTICPRPGIPLDVLEWYIAVIREETTRYIHSKSAAERNEIQRKACFTSLYFGYIWCETNLPVGKALENLTLAKVARQELCALQQVLRRVFPRGPARQLEASH